MKNNKHLSERPVFCTTTYRGWMLHQLLPVSRICLILWVLTFACRSVPVAMAGTLNIKAQASVHIEKDRLHVTAKAFNHGDEAAHNVQINIVLLGEQLKGPVRTVLGVNQSETFHVEKVISGIKQGRYPLTVMVDFKDANDYPFSALLGTAFYYEKEVDPTLVCVAHDLEMEKCGELRLEIQNKGADPKQVRATAFLPRELSTPGPQIDFQIESVGQKTILFEIFNSSALPGATYPVFCYLEYDAGDTHYTAVAKAVVEIAGQGNWLRRTQWFWIGLAVILGAAIIVYQFKNKR
jgi:hypothetical protein